MRLRVRYAKLGKIRFTSHRDTARHWERAVRKSGVHVAYSAGFTPRPRMSFGLALPTGGESLAEFLDIDLSPGGAELSADDLAERFDAALPQGYAVTRVVEREQGATSLQEAVVACTWRLDLVDVPVDEIADAVERVRAAAELPIERERKGERSVDDVRPAILDLDAADAAVTALLATTSRGLRPLELVTALLPTRDPVDTARRVLRTHQWIDGDGELRELLPVDAVAARPHEERG